MRMSSLRAIPVLALALAVLVAACGDSSSAPTSAPTPATSQAATLAPSPTAAPVRTATAAPVSSGELNIALAGINFDLIHQTGLSRPFLDPLYDYVVGTDIKGQFDPNTGLATSWTLGEWEKGATFTLKLRAGVKFSKLGNEATAHDVKVTVDRIHADGSRNTAALNYKRDIAATEVVDDRTFVLKINSAQSTYLMAQASRAATNGFEHLVNGKYWQQVGDAGYNKDPDGSGPYKFKSVTIGAEIAMEAVANHWLYGVPRTKSLTFKKVDEESTRLALIRTKQIDLGLISRASIKAMQSADGVVVVEKALSGFYNGRFHEQWKSDYPGHGKNPIADARVRQAMAYYAFDRQLIADTFFQGYATPAMITALTPVDPAYTNPAVTKVDIAKAKALLAEAGYPNGFEVDHIIVAAPAAPEGDAISLYISQQWEAIGIKVNRRPMDASQYRLAPVQGFSRPTVGTAAFYPSSNSVAVAPSLSDPSVAFCVERKPDACDPEYLRLSHALYKAKPEESLKAAQAVARRQYDDAEVLAIAYLSEYLAGNATKIPKQYDPGKWFSYNFDELAAKRY